MNIFTFIFILAVCAAVLAMLADYDKQEDKPQKKKDPCECCLRWYECNGVDDDCPLWKEVK